MAIVLSVPSRSDRVALEQATGGRSSGRSTLGALRAFLLNRMPAAKQSTAQGEAHVENVVSFRGTV